MFFNNFIFVYYLEESQIFNQRLTKIQKDKLTNFESDSWDEDCTSDNTEISIPSPTSDNYSNLFRNNNINEKNDNKSMIKRKVARKTSSNDYIKSQMNDDQQEFYNLDNQFEQLRIDKDDSKYVRNTKSSDYQLKSCT